MPKHVFTGLDSGPIQGGCLPRKHFKAETSPGLLLLKIDAELVAAVRSNGGSYYVNVAGKEGIDSLQIDNVELLNPVLPRTALFCSKSCRIPPK